MKNDSQIIWEMYNDGQDGKDKYINAISTLYNHFARHGGRGDDLHTITEVIRMIQTYHTEGFPDDMSDHEKEAFENMIEEFKLR